MLFTGSALCVILNVVIDRIEMLTVIERLHGSKYRCICDCGNERIVAVGHFNTGKIKSCGCHVVRHGHCRTRTRTYTSYHNMIARCHKKTNKRYIDYGAKGIVVCDRWRESFVNFLEDMGECPPGLTIDRTDNLKGYSPDNCRWVTRSVNQRNRESAIVWVVDGESYETMQDAATNNNVSTASIGAWCKGRISEGRHYSKVDGCYAYRKFTGERLEI